jgi:hypothetical protein
MTTCRGCGCSEHNPCILDLAGMRFTDEQLGELTDDELEEKAGSTCSWVEAGLCSACVVAPPPPPLLYDFAGRPLRGAP